MSAVDVLAVLGDLHRCARLYADSEGVKNRSPYADKMLRDADEARAAVAELVKAGELARVELKRQHAYNTGDEAGRVWSALQAMDAALARVTGAQS